MADQAPKEPTMEEILASIRKIISEDGTESAGAKTEAPDQPLKAENDEKISDISAELEALTETVVEEVLEERPDYADDFDDEFAEEAETVEEEVQVVETVEEVEAVDHEAEEPGLAEALEAAEAKIAEPEPVVEDEPVFEPVAEPAPVEMSADPESDMSASLKYQNTVLTEESTADAAAGALGKLISKMEFGGENTIEALVRELLKPMVKDWLDDNLARIVDEKVEAEVQRIARMAK